MFTRYQNLLLATTSIAIALLSMLLFFKLNHSQPTPKAHKHIQQIDSYIKNGHYQHYGKDGQLSYEVISPRAVHYTDGDHLHINKPTIIAKQEDKKAWVINALKGESYGESHKIELIGNVIATRENTQIKTDSLTAFPQQNYLQTNKTVTMHTPTLTLSGVGMRGDTEHGEITLLSQVQADITPDTEHHAQQ